MSSSSRHGPSAAARSPLHEAVEHAARLLPAQGPISVFVHHNPLHAFEALPFEAAVVEGGRRLGCEPLLPAAQYREHLAALRITPDDLNAVIAAELGDRAGASVGRSLRRDELWRRIVTHGIPAADGPPLEWLLGETDVLTRFRRDLPAAVRAVLLDGDERAPRPAQEATRVRALWRACVETSARSGHAPPPASSAPRSHRARLQVAAGVDIDAQIHPLLIRFTSAYLDQGYAHWSMPGRDAGMYACFLQLYRHRGARFSGQWAELLPQLVTAQWRAGHDAWASLESSLIELGVPQDEWPSFLRAEALALRGWAGMVRQLEERPDRVPARVLPARLVDFLAIRLLLTRAAVGHARRHAPPPTQLATRRPSPDPDAPPSPSAGAVTERAWVLFHAAQLCGLDAAALRGMTDVELGVFIEELSALDALQQRRMLHLAYERNFRHRVYDALCQHHAAVAPQAPSYQAIFCIDEREESIRRHLEEADPQVETFGVAGFFGVAMYFRGLKDAHPRPLCPVAIQPEHCVDEREEAPDGLGARLRATRRRLLALAGRNIHLGSRTLSRGAAFMAALGVLWLIPLVLRVVFPWSARLLRRAGQLGAGRPKTRLRVRRSTGAPALGRYAGYTVDEMAEIVRGQLDTLGVTQRLAPLVLIIGHGSASLNNPQESAHDCGACGGGRGGPNARALASMANDPEVRARLAAIGVAIPEATVFVGAERNTASSDIIFFDEDRVPAAARPSLAHAKARLEQARRREAHERCRRFAAAPTWLPAQAALAHVQARADDLGQPRPEYGHATNALCVVGRRSRTRGLFLDRRAFLVSYDPTTDHDGALLEGLLAAVVPVVAGINLEYFFGYVDPVGYGCGTKLPHNVTSLLGVMDGAQSDLRTGLPWQMLEIHEPVRLTIVVETPPALLRRLAAQETIFGRLVHHRWIFAAALDPDTGALHEVDRAGARAYTPAHPLSTVEGTSRAHYGGHRGHLPFAAIAPPSLDHGGSR